MSDNFAKIKCPACQNEMIKIFIPREGINVDVCLNGCGGMFFDNREYKYFDEQSEEINEIIKAEINKAFKAVDSTLPRTCPVCGARMVKNFASAKREIQVDDCYACGGKFLDYGELEKIRSQYKTDEERSKDTMKFLYENVGVEIKALQEEAEALRNSRSPLKKIFDKIVLG